MKSKQRRGVIAICTLLAFCIPLQVTAAESGSMMKKQQFKTESKEGYERLADFAEQIEENGKKYSLKDTSFEIVETNYLEKIKKQMETEEPPKEQITEDGDVYQLVNSTKEEKVIQEATEQNVLSYIESDRPLTLESVAPYQDVAVRNHLTGNSEMVRCKVTEIVPAGMQVVTNQMTITFQEYDAAYYEWNGQYIPKNDTAPALNGYETQLLASVGASEGSQVVGINWTGEPYVSADGVLCRDASATVEQKVQRYRANYEGVITTKAQMKELYKSTYETPDKKGRAEYTVLATGIYEREPSILPYIFTGAGILLLLGALVGSLFVIAKKRKEKKHGST